MANYPKVAIIGKPNVGKSTLFNRLIQKRISITSEESGTTRDRILHDCEWLGKTFTLIDTGGFLSNFDLDNFQNSINEQIDIALKQSDLIIFLVSLKEGITNEDLIIIKKIRNSSKPIILAVNKVDNKNLVNETYEFYKMGIKEIVPISSIHGIGISDLLDMVVKNLPNIYNLIKTNIPRIAIAGKPNVGKSTLVNSLLRDNRVIVSNIPGTTRDSVDTHVKYYNKEYIFTDTAGLKKNKDTLNDIEWYSELRTNLSILNSNIVLLMLDPSQEITKIDEQILQILKEEYKPTIILINKIDAFTKEEIEEFIKKVLNEFKFFNDPIIIKISALEKQKLEKIFDSIEQIITSVNQTISISSLNNFLIDIQMIKKPPRHNGINVKMSFITYTNARYPHFIIFSNHPEFINFSYKRFLENNIKRSINFKGVPIKISFKQK